MKKILRVIIRNVKQILQGAIYGREFRKNKKIYNTLNTNSNFQVNKHYETPCYLDRYKEAGTLGLYFWQDLWASRHLFEDFPESHYDIGSRIDGFISSISVFIKKVVLIDVRPLNHAIPNVSYMCMDAKNLDDIRDESVDSISSLCALEHFGLGRYGDEIDPDGCFKAFDAIQRVLKKGGKAYISVPIGKEHLEFDAHRVFYASSIVSAFSQMKLIEFAVIYEPNNYIEYDVPIDKYDNDEQKGGGRFGLFAFEKE